MSPIDRFGLDLTRIRFLPPSEANDELFFVEEDRRCKKDNTFSFARTDATKRPSTCAASRIQVRFDRVHDASRHRRLLQGRTHGRGPTPRCRRQRLLRRKEN